MQGAQPLRRGTGQNVLKLGLEHKASISAAQTPQRPGLKWSREVRWVHQSAELQNLSSRPAQAIKCSVMNADPSLMTVGKGLHVETAWVSQTSTHSYQQEFPESCILGFYPTKARVDL